MIRRSSKYDKDLDVNSRLENRFSRGYYIHLVVIRIMIVVAIIEHPTLAS